MLATRTLNIHGAWQDACQSAWHWMKALPWYSILIDAGLLALFVLSSTRLLRH